AAPMQAATDELRAAGDKDPDEYLCFNVTQALVEDKADKYIKMFGLCSCARCRIDVIALALSNLPAKYVVAKPHELIPRLSMYEQKYNAAVVTQVMSACRKVLDRPHHVREQ
ncbi:MAG: late competence development ComFB family protein, partial [Oscillospiraceae bacterium]|nr:late competence development ComFB family protein [Oscillospiraceae bacterium]